MKKTFLVTFITCIIVVATFVTTCTAETMSFSDGDFSNWTYGDYSSPGSWVTFAVNADGNPGNCLKAITQSGYAYGVAVNNSATYTPSTSGAINYVTMELDYKSISAWGNGQSLRVAAYQNGQYYGTTPAFDSGSLSTWNHLMSDQFAADSFRLISIPTYYGDLGDPSKHPDFSVTGSPISFGFMVGNGNTGTYTQLWDNWSLTVNVVPEPSTLAMLLGIGIIGIFGYAWRHRD